MGRRVLVAIAVLVVTAAVGSLGVRERRVEKSLAALAHVDRLDMGVEIRVVRKSPAAGGELVPGLPRMTLLGTHHFGGMVEIDGNGARYCGPSEDPVIWYASEQQWPLIEHADTLPAWMLIEGSEGSGKTRALAMWLALHGVLPFIGTDAETGVTAPTSKRLAHMRDAITKHWPRAWYRYNRNDDLYVCHAGPRIQLVSAVQRSEAGGSGVQGFTWVAHVGDELQDHFAIEGDIEARLRDPRAQGRAKRLCSSTQKDATEWRDFRETCRTSKPVEGESVTQWGVRKLLGLDSPFIFDRHWQGIRASGTMTEREWRRRILAEDVGPEKQVYFNWRRSFDNGHPANLAPIPAAARDVTAEVLAPWTSNASVLVGHDPGQRQQVSVFLKAFILPTQKRGDDRPRWFVVDEITSPEATVHAHAQQVLRRLRDRWGCHGTDRGGRPDPSAPVALVRIDPHTRGEGDSHPGADVSTIWKSLGMIARAAAYKASAATVEPLTIKRRQRIDMINTLLSATDTVGDVRRLFVAIRSGFLWPADEQDGKPAAPALVKAFETMEFNAAGKAEAEAKDADDLSHWPAALGYALWQVEAPRLGMGKAA